MQNASESEWDVHISLVLMFAHVKDKRKSRTEEMYPCYSHNTRSFLPVHCRDTSVQWDIQRRRDSMNQTTHPGGESHSSLLTVRWKNSLIRRQEGGGNFHCQRQLLGGDMVTLSLSRGHRIHSNVATLYFSNNEQNECIHIKLR